MEPPRYHHLCLFLLSRHRIANMSPYHGEYPATRPVGLRKDGGHRLGSVTRSFSNLCNSFFQPLLPGGWPRERVRAISNARLCALLRLHLRPIYVVVCDGPMGRSYLGEGFVLRCFQHLSWPDADTRLCTWRYNRQTGGLSNTVLSY